MNLSEWMDQEVAWRGQPEFLPGRGPAAGRVAGATRNEDRANLLLGGLFWQSYLASRAVERNVPEELLRYVVAAEPMIVFHGNGLFTLLLEAPGLEKVVTVPATPTASELEEGYFRYRSGWYLPESLSRRVSSLETSRNRELVQSQYQLTVEALWEVRGAQQPFVLTFAELPAVDLDLQQRVVTDRVTARGDSGAGLLDDDGYLLGFAHKRSASSANPSWSSWIWALAVFEKHQLALCD